MRQNSTEEWRSFPVMPSPIALEAGTNVGTIAQPKHLEMDMEIELSTTVSLRDGEPGGGEKLIPLLTQLLERVRDEIIPSFAGMY